MFILPDLSYNYSALEPFIDEETMHIHHDKHHAAYVKNLNDVLVGHKDLLDIDINKLLMSLNKVPEEIRQKVKNNAGGVANHSFFWNIMCSPSLSVMPIKGNFAEDINKTFGSFDAFKEKFSTVALGHFGSGWAWLVSNNGKLEVVDTLNQDSPVSEGKVPLLVLDVWEHAYYLKYRNLRTDYINAWWNVVNWKGVEKLYDELQ
jgi:superoxide dismutase, Fe-Mn family